MATEKESSSQHDKEGQTESTTTVADGSLVKKGVGNIFKGIEMMLEESTTVTDRKPTKKGKAKIFKGVEMLVETFICVVAKSVVETIIEKIFDESRKRNEEKATKALESRTDETSQELIKTVKALQEYLKELKESKQCECQRLRAQPEENQGENEEGISNARMISNFQQLSQRIETLEERLQQLVQSS